MDKSKQQPNWAKILKATAYVGYQTVKAIWLIIWTLYQIALGAVLVLIVWGFFRVGEYFSLWDIRNLRHENPQSTAFIDTQRARLTDSLKARGVWPPPDTLIKWSWVPFDSIPKVVQEVALIAEDAKFFEHQGFDLEQIEYAVVANHQAGKKARGASTITQQLAKNLYLSGDKEMSRKLREAVITLEMEHFLPKERILEVYLNVAQFDEDVFGIREAARHYLKKEMNELTQDDAVNLICLLPSPSKWNFRKPNSAYLQHKRLVMRNYAMFKGLKQKADSSVTSWQDSVYSNLAEQLSDERWKGLRTKPVFESSSDSSEAANREGESSPIGDSPRSGGAEPRAHTGGNRVRTF
jgi:monofunctional biosynthetic peptidoglycan transglycosylase